MTPTTVTTHARRLLLAIMIAALPHSVEAAGCQFEMQGSGRVSTIIDGRTFRLDDGSEVRLAGIELPSATSNTAPLAALIAGREVSLRGASDMPDRYGRQPAFVFTDRPLRQQEVLDGAAASATRGTTASSSEPGRAQSGADPEVDLAQRGTAGLEVALLPAVAVLQPFPLLGGLLHRATEAPAVLVVDRHDVRRIGRGQPRRVAHDQQVLVVDAAGLGPQVVRAGQQHRVLRERVHQHHLAVHHGEGIGQLLELAAEPLGLRVDGGGNPRGHAVARLDRGGEGGFVPRA
eukprot:gene2952-4033_t